MTQMKTSVRAKSIVGAIIFMLLTTPVFYFGLSIIAFPTAAHVFAVLWFVIGTPLLISSIIKEARRQADILLPDDLIKNEAEKIYKQRGSKKVIFKHKVKDYKHASLFDKATGGDRERYKKTIRF